MNLASQINNSASCISTALVPNSQFFDLAWQIHEEEKARFCIYFIACQMEYRARPSSTVFCIARETCVETTGWIKHLSLNCHLHFLLLTMPVFFLPFALFSPFFSPFFCVETLTFHPRPALFLHSWAGLACVIVLQPVSVWHYGGSSKRWDSPCHQVMFSGCVQTQGAQTDLLCVVLLVFVCLLCGHRNRNLSTSTYPEEPKTARGGCNTALNYSVLNFTASTNTVVSLVWYS